MRITSSLWLTLACVLIAAIVPVGKAAAGPSKRGHAHRKPRRHVPAHVLGQRAAQIGQRMIGVPYSWAGASPSGFECSGLVVFAYGRLGA